VRTQLTANSATTEAMSPISVFSLANDKIASASWL
jgi:hypothetical protein